MISQVFVCLIYVTEVLCGLSYLTVCGGLVGMCAPMTIRFNQSQVWSIIQYGIAIRVSIIHSRHWPPHLSYVPRHLPPICRSSFLISRWSHKASHSSTLLKARSSVQVIMQRYPFISTLFSARGGTPIIHQHALQCKNPLSPARSSALIMFTHLTQSVFAC